MIPRLDANGALRPETIAFLEALRAGEFSGDIETAYASRLVVATDNSVYQLVPDAVVFPKSADDVVRLARLAAAERFRKITLVPRGGGTGTNGQALGDGIVVDLSRHMNRILEVNLERGWVRVEPGVVLDELNAHLRPHGVFFAPSLSPSNRATLGGMIATDACGKGSRVYGRTSNHVFELSTVLADGTTFVSRPLTEPELVEVKARGDRVGAVHRLVDEIATTHAALIDARFPKMPRFLTGYDLAHVRRPTGYAHDPMSPEGAPTPAFNLNSILTGSEGTLVFVTEAKLRVIPLPKHQKLVAVKYRSFHAALAAARELLSIEPSAIETIDETILRLAQDDVIWHRVGPILERSGDGASRVVAVNLVEIESDDSGLVDRKVTALVEELGRAVDAAGFVVAETPAERAALWDLRKKGVGLLGAAKGARRPVPFIEDTAVPPERLAEYIAELRALLDAEGLVYGMFGHVDVGCLHVRPALDLRSPSDEALLRKISDRVVELVKKYGGVLWSEHGKGFRSEYSPDFFGVTLYRELCRIKEAFDPHNQMNPGKLATPLSREDRLISIDAVKRGTFDRQIAKDAADHYAPAVHCNGNGACFSWDPDAVMCPSSKGTRDRIHSPKGRAALLREWLRLLSGVGLDPTEPDARAASWWALPIRWGRSLVARRARASDFSHEVYDAMAGCLACKACATECPIRVDVPAMKSDFLALYHSRYARPLGDHFVAALEHALVWLAAAPTLFNRLFSARWFQRLLSGTAGIVDSPLLSAPTLSEGLRARGAPVADVDALTALSAEERDHTIVLIQDAFTTFYEANVALASYDLLTAIGYRVFVAPYRPNGKGLHVKGFVDRFAEVARKNAGALREVAAVGVPLVGVEPAVVLTYRDEYPRALGEPRVSVLLLEEVLARSRLRITDALERRRKADRRSIPERISVHDVPRYRLFSHCTERTAHPSALTEWREVFSFFGLDLDCPSIGCCGMCGAYGHERAHQKESRGIYALSWENKIPESPDGRALILATGHSCRSQVKRFSGFSPMHPVEALLRELEG